MHTFIMLLCSSTRPVFVSATCLRGVLIFSVICYEAMKIVCLSNALLNIICTTRETKYYIKICRSNAHNLQTCTYTYIYNIILFAGLLLYGFGVVTCA